MARMKLPRGGAHEYITWRMRFGVFITETQLVGVNIYAWSIGKCFVELFILH